MKILIFLLLNHFMIAGQDIIHDGSSGFYTPPRKGKIWDTWMYYYNGTYYMYYLGGEPGKWDTHELATSTDGVNWEFKKVIIEPRAGTEWIGTGHIIKSPNFENDNTWISNYSEWCKTNNKQDIMFATSKNLIDWEKVDESRRFQQDTRWYKESGRWDCIDVIEGDDGYLYGYFTADPDPEKIDYNFCGFGFARSKDGINWEALPPLMGDMHGEFGGIEKIGDKYYITISEGRIGVGDSFRGPFLKQEKNHSMFDGDIYFPRFFHARDTPDGKPLVNHFYTQGIIYSAPLKDIEVDAEGTLRLKWWNGNEVLKSNLLSPDFESNNGVVRMMSKIFQPGKTYVIEGRIKLSPKDPEHDLRGIYFSNGDSEGAGIIFSGDKTSFGNVMIKDETINMDVINVVSRDLDFGDIQDFRIVLCNDMVEVYVNNYLTVIQRVKYDGQIGIMFGGDTKSVEKIKMWSN